MCEWGSQLDREGSTGTVGLRRCKMRLSRDPYVGVVESSCAEQARWWLAYTLREKKTIFLSKQKWLLCQTGYRARQDVSQETASRRDCPNSTTMMPFVSGANTVNMSCNASLLGMPEYLTGPG